MAPGAPVKDTHDIILPARYEIRLCTPDTAEWVSALNWYNQFFGSEVLSGVHAGDLARQVLTVHRTLLDGFRGKDMPPSNGLSYMVIDKEYVYKRPESESTGGALYWHELDVDDPALADDNVAKRKLRDGMDFSIVSLVLSTDDFVPRDTDAWKLRRSVLPKYYLTNEIMEEHDHYPKEPRHPTGLGQVIERLGTSTLEGYEGLGLMKKLSHFVLLELRSRGFRGFSIDALAPQVHHVWANPPPGFKATTVAESTLRDYETKDDQGVIYRPFAKSKFDRGWKVWVEVEE